MEPWKQALLEVLHVDRVKVEEESYCALLLYKWFLAMRAVSCVFCLRRCLLCFIFSHDQSETSFSRQIPSPCLLSCPQATSSFFCSTRLSEHILARAFQATSAHIGKKQKVKASMAGSKGPNR